MKRLFIILSVLLFASCSTLKKVNCYSTKTYPVTFITKNGYMYTINVPFCDTVKLHDDNLPDSVKGILKGM
jgi:uncharacterized lipoprotein YajG